MLAAKSSSEQLEDPWLVPRSRLDAVCKLTCSRALRGID